LLPGFFRSHFLTPTRDRCAYPGPGCIRLNQGGRSPHFNWVTSNCVIMPLGKVCACACGRSARVLSNVLATALDGAMSGLDCCF